MHMILVIMLLKMLQQQPQLQVLQTPLLVAVLILLIQVVMP